MGYVYVPEICRSRPCRLHVAFHGCRQYADAQGEDRVRDDFVRDAGYNGWAAANRIVVLYPQATVTGANPNGCWDFWGYSGPGWRTRDGVQMDAVSAMILKLRRAKPAYGAGTKTRVSSRPTRSHGARNGSRQDRQGTIPVHSRAVVGSRKRVVQVIGESKRPSASAMGAHLASRKHALVPTGLRFGPVAYDTFQSRHHSG